jgi:Mrp family chromosome partitioning ATPase
VADVAVLAAGGTGAGTARAWAAGALAKLLDGLKAEFALLVVDLPPADHAGFVPPLAGLLDGALLVVEAERTRGEAARRQKDLLAAAGARLLGAVLNKNRRFL